MPSKKIVCLGGGSLYFRRALPDLAVVEGLAGSEIILYDIDTEKAELMAQFGRRLADLSGTGLRVRACSDLTEAVDGADFAISSIGGAGRSRRGVYDTSLHKHDLLIPARYGIYQLIGDTCGPAAMMMAFRSIPAYLTICHEMEKRCPGVVFLNHSNPMAVLCRAMIKHTGINSVIGICHGVQGGIVRVARILGVPPEELDTVWVGTNHYHWFTRIYHRGHDVYPELRRRIASRESSEGEVMTTKLSEIYGYQIAYPPDDHGIEFYPFLAQVQDGRGMPYGLGEEVVARYGEDLYGDLTPRKEPEVSETDLEIQRQKHLQDYAAELARTSLPEKPSDPVTGEGLGRLIEDITLGRRGVYIVNIPNRGAIPNLPDYAIVEVEGVTDACGVRPVYTGEAPLSLMGLLQKRIAWQELVADAGATGDRRLALQALLLDEMAIVPEKAEKMLDELLASSDELLPQFFGAP
jgi:alpha-galactosidase